MIVIEMSFLPPSTHTTPAQESTLYIQLHHSSPVARMPAMRATAPAEVPHIEHTSAGNSESGNERQNTPVG
jgi:hypothetical protein